MKKYPDEIALMIKTADRIEGIRVGEIIRVDEIGNCWIDFPGNMHGPIIAGRTSSVKVKDLQKHGTGKKVLLVFENNDPKLPIIIDTMHTLLDEMTESQDVVLEAKKPEDVMIDGKRITFDAKEEIVLKCGKASITLTKAGKVIIRGAYVLSRSSGVNRVKGGSVQIN
jgi:hypothetical protein